MSSHLKSDNDYSFDIDELLQIGRMCRELRKEKDMLKESQAKSAEAIRRLESDIKSLSEGRSEDAECIQQLERELRNSSKEIEYWQDQLNLRNIEANYLGEHVHSLELKLTEVDILKEKVSQLEKELLNCNSERLFFMSKLENKDIELQKSTFYVEKLEELISSLALESECEIESMKLDLIALEHTSSEAKKSQEIISLEKARMDEVVEMLSRRFHDSQKKIIFLEKENKELREKTETSQRNGRMFVEKVEECLGEWLERKDRSVFSIQTNNESKLSLSKEISTCEEVLGPLFSKLAVAAATSEGFKAEMVKLSLQIHEYEHLVKQLQDDLREEKLKAKEEAEDLIQEMAELRYQFRSMLEEECKRRACIEQASLQRIAELEAQISKEQRKSSIDVKQCHQVQKLVGS